MLATPDGVIDEVPHAVSGDEGAAWLLGAALPVSLVASKLRIS